jgi:hypothetical protein
MTTTVTPQMTNEQIRSNLRRIMYRCGAYIFLWLFAAYYVVPMCLDLGIFAGKISVILYSLAGASHTVLTFGTEYERVFSKNNDGENHG